MRLALRDAFAKLSAVIKNTASSKSIPTEKQVGQLAKAVAICAVVGLHFLALFPETLYTAEGKGIYFIVLNQIARFSVPLFLALSGFGLARKYQHEIPSLREFFMRRVSKLLPPYLLWSVILLAIMRISDSWQQSQGSLWESLLYGEADYHLYFVPVIFQLYLLFVFLLKIKRRQLLWLVLASGLLQAVWFVAIRYLAAQESTLLTGLTDDQVQYRLLTNWIFYFVFGVLLSQLNLERLRRLTFLKPVLALVVLGSLVWAVTDSQEVIKTTGDIIFATGFTRLPVFVYATGVITAVTVYGQQLLAGVSLEKNPLMFIGRHSYAIYLSHTLVLRIIEAFMEGGTEFAAVTLAAVLLATGLVASKQFSVG